jgi:putative solute:sodium symporter small subunit
MSQENPPAVEPIFPQPAHLSPAVQASLRRYWRSNLKLMGVLLVIWAAAGLGAGVLFADFLNEFKLGGYPLGFWFAQQGSIVVFVLVILVYAVALNRLDAKHHAEIEALKKNAAGGQT